MTPTAKKATAATNRKRARPVVAELPPPPDGAWKPFVQAGESDRDYVVRLHARGVEGDLGTWTVNVARRATLYPFVPRHIEERFTDETRAKVAKKWPNAVVFMSSVPSKDVMWSLVDEKDFFVNKMFADDHSQLQDWLCHYMGRVEEDWECECEQCQDERRQETAKKRGKMEVAEETSVVEEVAEVVEAVVEPLVAPDQTLVVEP